MPYRITHTSTHPNYIDFSTWIDMKKSQAQTAGNAAEVQNIENALAAKANANSEESVGTTTRAFEDGTLREVNVREQLTNTVPEFDSYWNQWATEFNVQVLIEDF